MGHGEWHRPLLEPYARPIVTVDNTTRDFGAGGASLKCFSLTLLGAEGEGSTSVSPTALSQTCHTVEALSLYLGSHCSPSPVHIWDSTKAFTWKSQWSRKVFVLWGEVQLVFLPSGEKKRNQKPDTNPSTELHGIQTHSPRYPYARGL